jgi:hypothetical protein
MSGSGTVTASLFILGASFAVPTSEARAGAPRAKSEYETLGFGFEFKGGPYLPRLESESFDLPGSPGDRVSPFAEVYGTSPNPLYTIGADLHL